MEMEDAIARKTQWEFCDIYPDHCLEC